MIGEHQVIHDVSLNIAQGDFVALLGGNGAGKTSLFKTIVGILKPAKGTVEFKGEAINHTLPTKSWGKFDFCPEGRQLFPALSVHKNLMLGAYHRKDKKAIEETARAGLHHVSEASRSATSRLPVRSAGASSRCWLSAARSCPSRRCCFLTSLPWGWRRWL